MEFLIFSDSHGRKNVMTEVFRRQPSNPQWVLFLGDGLGDFEDGSFGMSRTLAVCGNCDRLFYAGEPTEQILEVEGHRILLTHGHLFGAKSGTGALVRATYERNCDIVLFGHTHEPYLETIPAGESPLARTLYLFNPGSLREGSFGTLTLRGENVLFSHGEA